jgi:long-chain acyl-CoA synthetase
VAAERFWYIPRRLMPTFYSRFLDCAQRWPNAVAVEVQGKSFSSFTYAELARMSASVGRWLTESGFGQGTHCAILAANSPRWVAAHLGILAAGCTVVPLDVAWHADQLARLLTASDAGLLFVDGHHLVVAQEAIASRPLPIVVLDSAATPATGQVLSSFDQIEAAGPDNFAEVPLPPSSTAAILFTSGTTADPTGVMLSHENLMGETECVFAALKVGPDDAILGVLPLFHALAQMANLLLPLACGARVVYLETLNTAELLRALRERNITLFACVPQFFYLIHERIMKEVERRGGLAGKAFGFLRKSSRALRTIGVNPGRFFFSSVHQTLGRKMRFLITGGSRFDGQIGEAFYELGFDILQGYGLTETTGCATFTRPGHNVIGCVGPPLPGVQAKLLNPTPSEKDSGREIGEVAIKGPVVMQGYYKRPDSTAAVLQDGWLRTGDLGYFDDEGNLFITGRIKDVIVLSSGKNIYPEEIEQHYLKSPFIKEICVVGLQSSPGAPLAENLHGVIVPNLELMRERKIVNASETLRFDIEGLSAELPGSKRILHYEIWQQDLPRTTTRKLKRFAIEKEVRRKRESGGGEPEGSPEGVQAETIFDEQDQLWLDRPEVSRAINVIRSMLRNHHGPIRPGDNLDLDLGFDSMQRVELLVELQQEFGTHVSESVLSQVYTVRELVEAVLEGKGADSGQPMPSAIAWDSVLQRGEPAPEVVAAARRRPIVDEIGYIVGTGLQIFARDRFNLQVSGVDKLPPSGPFILCPNHQSFVDPLGIALTLPWRIFRDSFSLGTTEVFGAGMMRMIARLVKVVPVDADAALIPAMRAGAYGLKRGKILLLYPEGERSLDGTPKKFKRGAAILSIHLRVPIVPVALDGFFDVWPRGKAYQGHAPVRVAYGNPIYPPALPAGGKAEVAYEQLTSELREKVIALWEQIRIRK